MYSQSIFKNFSCEFLKYHKISWNTCVAIANTFYAIMQNSLNENVSFVFIFQNQVT